MLITRTEYVFQHIYPIDNITCTINLYMSFFIIWHSNYLFRKIDQTNIILIILRKTLLKYTPAVSI